MGNLVMHMTENEILDFELKHRKEPEVLDLLYLYLDTKDRKAHNYFCPQCKRDW